MEINWELFELIYGPRGTHGSAIAFRKGPRGSQLRWHHGDVSALLSAFTAPEERMEARSLSGRARKACYCTEMAPWECVPALLSAFTAPEERMEAQTPFRRSPRGAHHFAR